jgi:hypothetical protein
MEQALSKRNNYFVLFSLALIIGVLLFNVYSDIHENGVIFILPVFVVCLISSILLIFEKNYSISELGVKGESNAINSRDGFLLRFLSFHTIGSFWILSFFSFLEAIFSATIFGFALNIFFKFIEPESSIFFLGTKWFISVTIILWLLSLFFRVISGSNEKFKWLKFLLSLFLVCSFVVFSAGVIYNPKYIFELVVSIDQDSQIKNIFYLKPNTIWDASVWLRSAGKTMLIFSILSLFPLYLKTESNGLQGNKSKYFNWDYNLVTLSCTFLCVIFGLYIMSVIQGNWDYFSSYHEVFERLDFILIFVILVLFLGLFIFHLNNQFYHVYLHEGIRMISSVNYLSRFFTTERLFFILIIVFGSFLGLFFYFVQFESYPFWIGCVLLVLSLGRYIILLKMHFNFQWKNKSIQLKENHTLSFFQLILIKYVFPSLFLPVFIGLIPVLYSDFLLDKSLDMRIEYLQNAGRISSYHHQREPIVFRDHYSVLIAIDSNKIKLNEIDSLSFIQKDSIRFYLENRKLKKDEPFRFRELQLSHDIDSIKNVSRIALFLLLGFFIYNYLSWGKSRGD